MRWLPATLLLVFWVPAVSAPARKQSPNSVQRNAAKRSAPPKRTARRAAARPKPAPISARTRAAAARRVTEFLEGDVTIENPAALIPFFEQLSRHEKGELEEPLRILHYGDSHTAADEWTGALRSHFQSRFGSGGGGYSLAGRPWNSYRRLDLRSFATRGWHSDGLVGRQGDGRYGLGGVSISTTLPRESIALEAGCEQVEIYYLQQPGGGSLELYVEGQPTERISTEGELGPGYFGFSLPPGHHRFELRTLDRAPVRLFGWVTENNRGVTYETLGINGAQASIILNWDEVLTASHLARRNPALIVLAYGTNEAGNRDWTSETYRAMFSALINRFRAAAPAASILVIAPPDREYRTRGRWLPFDRLDMIIAAQRQAALESNCGFWDLRGKMGGKGSMRQWVLAGLAQNDHVHFTTAGYRLLGDAVFHNVMDRYGRFIKMRDEAGEQVADGQTRQDP